MTRSGGLTSRKKHDTYVRRAPFRDAKLIVIATEGAVTEPRYFTLFTERDGTFFNPRVRRIDVLETLDGGSAPERVLDRLRVYKQKYDISTGDQFWLVVDVDRWQCQGVLDPVIAAAFQDNIQLAISNPRFEVWLLCHFVDSLTEITDLDSAIKSYLGNVKTKFEISRYSNRVRHAVEVASKSVKGTDPNIPQPLGTNVFKLVQEIIPAQ